MMIYIMAIVDQSSLIARLMDLLVRVHDVCSGAGVAVIVSFQLEKPHVIWSF